MPGDYINIGPCPTDEEPVQLGRSNYPVLARKECIRFIALIRKVLGLEPEGARLGVKSFPHDFGSYYEVVCYYQDSLPDSLEYALKCEGERCPESWIYEGVDE